MNVLEQLQTNYEEEGRKERCKDCFFNGNYNWRFTDAFCNSNDILNFTMNKTNIKDIRKDYFERTIHDQSFDTEEGRWKWIENKLIKILDMVTLEEKEELEGFDTCRKTEFRILGYNDAVKDLNKLKETIKEKL